MALPVWGNLEKSQIDSETIEEAIARLIQAHEDDLNAHVEAGESLQSHKAAEIIDHLVNSIIADKIKNKEITVEKLNWDKFLLEPTLESLDGWYVSNPGTDAEVRIVAGACLLITGKAVGNTTYITLEGMVRAAGFDLNPFFQCMLDFSSAPESQDVAVACGLLDPFDEDEDSFGFRWSEADDKMYAWSYDGANETKTEITGFNSGVENTFRAEMTDNGDTIKFYVNGVLKATHENANCDIDSNFYFSVGNKCQLINNNLEAVVHHIIFCEDW